MEEIIAALRNRFTNAEILMRPGEDGGRIHGFLIWQGFEPLTFLERQQIVRGTLRNALNGQAEQVGMVFTYTPHEYEQIRED